MGKYHSTPNNDRSRSLNRQDSWGKAAEANYTAQTTGNKSTGSNSTSESTSESKSEE